MKEPAGCDTSTAEGQAPHTPFKPGPTHSRCTAATGSSAYAAGWAMCDMMSPAVLQPPSAASVTSHTRMLASQHGSWGLQQTTPQMQQRCRGPDTCSCARLSSGVLKGVRLLKRGWGGGGEEITHSWTHSPHSHGIAHKERSACISRTAAVGRACRAGLHALLCMLAHCCLNEPWLPCHVQTHTLVCST